MLKVSGRGAKGGALALLVATVVGVGGAGVPPVSAAAAAPTQVFTPAAALALPASATATPDGELNAISCVSPGDCTAVGDERTTRGDVPMVTSQSGGGVYPAATALTPPASADGAQLTAVSCPSAGQCVATGFARDANGNSDPIIADESNGTWGTPAVVSLPTDADGPSSQNARLSSVSCWSAGNCVAVGTYDASGSGALIAAETDGGAWRTSELTALPAGATTASLDAVSCTGDGRCTAGGQSRSGTAGPLIVSGAGANLGQPQTLALPSDASATGSGGVTGISCPGDGACSAIGTYVTATGQPAIAWTQTSGAFGRPVALDAPSDASGGAPVSYTSISCPSPGDCTATGTAGGATGIESAAVSESGGSWDSAMQLSQPTGAVASPRADIATEVSCTAVDVCGLAGSYATDASGDSAAMTLSSHMSLVIATTSLPAGVGGVPYDAELSATGGAGSESWVVTAGALPAGLTLDPSTGVVSGIPAVPGASSFTVAVGDSASDTPATAALAIAVDAPPPPTPTVTRVSVRGLTVRATVSCAGTSIQTCTGVGKASAAERRGRKIVSVVTHRGRKWYRTVVLGRAAYSVAAGHTETITLHLGRTARRLRASHRRLRVAFTLTATGSRRANVTQKFVLRGRRARKTTTRHRTAAKRHRGARKHTE